MARRSISAKQRSWLAAQLDDWKSQQLISGDQSSRILDLYETQAELADRGRSNLLLVLMGIAAVLIGLAVLLLIGYNWSAMPAALKLVAIFATLLATLVLGFYLRFHTDHRMLSEVVFCLGCLFFGAAIFLVAQIFHLSGHYPDTVWWWALGVLPFALCMDSLLLHALLVALLAIWCGMEVLGFNDLGMWWLWGRWGFIPNGAYSLILLAVPGLVWAYRHRSVATATLYVALIAWWTVIQPFAWRLEELSPIFIGAVGALMLLIAGSHPQGSRFAKPYRELGVLMVAGVLLLMSFHEATKEIYEHRSYGGYYGESNDWRLRSFMGSAGGWALLGATAIATLGILYVASKLQVERSSSTSSPSTAMGETARRLWMPLGMLAMMLLFFVWWLLDRDALLPTILANVAMIVLGFWLISLGLREESGRTFGAGVVYLLMWCVMRYIDLFGDFGGMLGAAGMFMACGVALFAVAWFWRHRKEVAHA